MVLIVILLCVVILILTGVIFSIQDRVRYLVGRNYELRKDILLVKERLIQYEDDLKRCMNKGV